MVKFKSCKYCGKSFVQHNINSHYCSIPCRFWDKVKIGSPYKCWEWQRSVNIYGYGKFSIKFKDIIAHRYSFELVFGKIPYGLCCLHKCDNPKCVNPFHLFIGTNADNVADMFLKNRQRNQDGVLNNIAKLSEKQVLDIRSYFAQGCKYKDIVKFFNVSLSTIYDICDNRTWTHI